jgi:hypothetical protein
MSFTISQTFDRRFASLKGENVNRPTDPIDSNGRKDKNDTRDDLFFGAIHSTRRCCGAAKPHGHFSRSAEGCAVALDGAGDEDTVSGFPQ